MDVTIPFEPIKRQIWESTSEKTHKIATFTAVPLDNQGPMRKVSFLAMSDMSHLY
jgi:hypothetical protein